MTTTTPREECPATNPEHDVTDWPDTWRWEQADAAELATLAELAAREDEEGPDEGDSSGNQSPPRTKPSDGGQTEG